MGINGKNTVSVFGINYLKRHRGGTVNGIFVATSRTEAAFAAEGNKFKSATGRAAIHGTAKCRITAVNHSVNIFNDRLAGMQSINNLFVVIFENVLKYVAHKIIMKEKEKENNPLIPSRLRARELKCRRHFFSFLLNFFHSFNFLIVSVSKSKCFLIAELRFL